MRQYFWPIIIAVVIVVVWIENSNRSDVRLFCSYGRVFIEFQEGYTVWGTIMLDNNGLPVPCDENIKTNYKETI